jgi:dihydrofolate reductase
MARLIVSEWVTLDGVAQAPISPAEDSDGAFAHGGWHVPHAGDPAAQQWMLDAIAGAGGYVLGRRTYESLAAYWPHAPAAERTVAEPLNTRPKYVATRAPGRPLAWANATALAGDAPAAVAALKAGPGGDLLLMGSTELARALFAHDLVDEVRLTIDPVVVGGGKRPFPDGALTALRLVEHRATGTGAILARYVRGPARGPARGG